MFLSVCGSRRKVRRSGNRRTVVNAENLQDIRKYFDRHGDFIHREKKYNSSEKNSICNKNFLCISVSPTESEVSRSSQELKSFYRTFV